jgi:hypothetical protein
MAEAGILPSAPSWMQERYDKSTHCHCKKCPSSRIHVEKCESVKWSL